MGYVKPEYAAEGTDIFIPVRDKKLKAKVVKVPFYKAKV
jgi:aminomethyltransferase